MSYAEDIDTKSVKKGKFGPLDVYPQEEKQREVRKKEILYFLIYKNSYYKYFIIGWSKFRICQKWF